MHLFHIKKYFIRWSSQRTELSKKILRLLDLYTRRGRDLDNIEYRCIYRANLKKTEIIANYQVAEAEGLFARLIPSRDLFTSEIQGSRICCAHDVCGIAVR